MSKVQRLPIGQGTLKRVEMGDTQTDKAVGEDIV